jgi:hypothetical protein
MPAFFVQNLISAPQHWPAVLQNLCSIGLATCFYQASGRIFSIGRDTVWFAFLQDQPPYMVYIFVRSAVFRKTILRSSFADPSFLARFTLLVDILLYLAVGFDRANGKGLQLKLATTKRRLAIASLLLAYLLLAELTSI